MLGSPPGGGGVLGGLGWSPWKRPRRTPLRYDDNVYDLYAICNHHGQDLQGGHYTGMEVNDTWLSRNVVMIPGENLLQTLLSPHIGKERTCKSFCFGSSDITTVDSGVHLIIPSSATVKFILFNRLHTSL
jgi:hypothetical protein